LGRQDRASRVEPLEARGARVEVRGDAVRLSSLKVSEAHRPLSEAGASTCTTPRSLSDQWLPAAAASQRHLSAILSLT